jgi:hypothetical protein
LPVTLSATLAAKWHSSINKVPLLHAKVAHCAILCNAHVLELLDY